MGCLNENRYMTECFLDHRMPEENWNDGLLVTQLLMTAYKSSELGKKIKFDGEAIRSFVPKVAQGTYRSSDPLQATHL